jgi:hypothetical protein
VDGYHPGSNPKEAFNEFHLSYRISIVSSRNLSLPQHVQRFNPFKRPLRRVKRAAALCGASPPLDRPVVLFGYVVEVSNTEKNDLRPEVPPLERGFILLQEYDSRRVIDEPEENNSSKVDSCNRASRRASRNWLKLLSACSPHEIKASLLTTTRI